MARTVMQYAEESRSSEEAHAPCAFSDFALRIAGPADGRLEVSVDGAAYRPCRYADGFWWYHWSGTLESSHHMVIVLRSTVEEPAHRA